MLAYHAAYYQYEEDDGWYVVKVLDFPGVASQGRTLNSARRMIRSALRDMVQWYMEDGQALPRPNARARDNKAAHLEKISVRVLIGTGAVT